MIKATRSMSVGLLISHWTDSGSDHEYATMGFRHCLAHRNVVHGKLVLFYECGQRAARHGRNRMTFSQSLGILVATLIVSGMATLAVAYPDAFRHVLLPIGCTLLALFVIGGSFTMGFYEGSLRQLREDKSNGVTGKPLPAPIPNWVWFLQVLVFGSMLVLAWVEPMLHPQPTTKAETPSENGTAQANDHAR